MLNETTLEQLLVTLEAAISDLRRKLEEKPTSKMYIPDAAKLFALNSRLDHG